MTDTSRFHEFFASTTTQWSARVINWQKTCNFNAENFIPFSTWPGFSTTTTKKEKETAKQDIVFQFRSALIDFLFIILCVDFDFTTDSIVRYWMFPLVLNCICLLHLYLNAQPAPIPSSLSRSHALGFCPQLFSFQLENWKQNTQQ